MTKSKVKVAPLPNAKDSKPLVERRADRLKTYKIEEEEKMRNVKRKATVKGQKLGSLKSSPDKKKKTVTI